MSGVSYMQFLIEEARLVLLRVLAEAAEYTSNSSLLAMALDRYGITLSRDQVNTQLAWLAEQQLVRTEQIATIVRATLTLRGLDVATGTAIVPGVKRPSPKA